MAREWGTVCGMTSFLLGNSHTNRRIPGGIHSKGLILLESAPSERTQFYFLVFPSQIPCSNQAPDRRVPHAAMLSSIPKPERALCQDESQSKPGTKMVYPEPCFKIKKADIRNYFWLGLSLTSSNRITYPGFDCVKMRIPSAVSLWLPFTILTRGITKKVQHTYKQNTLRITSSNESLDQNPVFKWS